MGKNHDGDSGNTAHAKNICDGDYAIRIPLKMFQLTEKDGKAWPIAFEWENPDGEIIEIKIERIISVTPASELKSGTVGDRYDVEIEGRRDYLFYSKLAPRKWFKVVSVSEQEYNAYYKLPGES